MSKPEMIHEPLWESAKDIVEDLVKEIKDNGENIRLRESIMGWQYGQRVFESGMKKLMDDMMTKKGYKVVECSAFHFVKPARILNPTKRYLLLPIEGSAKLEPGGTLSNLLLYLIEDDEPILEVGEGGIDMICMALENKGGDNSVWPNVGEK